MKNLGFRQDVVSTQQPMNLTQTKFELGKTSVFKINREKYDW